MTRRDLAWRLGGLALFAAASGIGLSNRSVAGDTPGSIDIVLGLLGFMLAITGAVLLVQGKRVPIALLAERRRYRAGASAVVPAGQHDRQATRRRANPSMMTRRSRAATLDPGPAIHRVDLPLLPD